MCEREVILEAKKHLLHADEASHGRRHVSSFFLSFSQEENNNGPKHATKHAMEYQGYLHLLEIKREMREEFNEMLVAKLSTFPNKITL